MELLPLLSERERVSPFFPLTGSGFPYVSGLLKFLSVFSTYTIAEAMLIIFHCCKIECAFETGCLVDIDLIDRLKKNELFEF